MDSKVSFNGRIDVTVGKALAMLGFVKGLSCDFWDPFLSKPFMFPLCVRSLNTPVVCGGFSMAHTSIELSVCRGSS
jgi:hypothetical protein